MVNTISVQTGHSGKLKVNRLLSILTPWIQLLNMYGLISGVTVGYALIVLIDLLYIAFGKHKKTKVQLSTKQSRWVFLFLVTVTALLPVGMLLSDNVSMISIANRLVKMYAIYILVMVMHDRKMLDWNAYRKSLEVLVIIACVVIIYQFLSNMLLGYYYDIRIPFLNYSREATNTKLAGISTETRFRSLFTEPSYFVYFIFQYLPVLLFDALEERSLTYKEFIFAGIITVCVVLSVSSTGLFLLAFVWCTYFYISFRNGRLTTKDLLLAVLAVVGLTILVIVYLNNSTLSFSTHRMTSAYSQSKVVWWRFSAGFEYVEEMNSWQRLFGYGMGNFHNDTFMNGVAYTVICSGFIGLVVVIGWMTSNFFNTTLCGKVATIIWTLLIVIEIMALYAPPLIGYAIMVNHYQKNKSRKANYSYTSD